MLGHRASWLGRWRTAITASFTIAVLHGSQTQRAFPWTTGPNTGGAGDRSDTRPAHPSCLPSRSVRWPALMPSQACAGMTRRRSIQYPRSPRRTHAQRAGAESGRRPDRIRSRSDPQETGCTRRLDAGYTGARAAIAQASGGARSILSTASSRARRGRAGACPGRWQPGPGCGINRRSTPS